MFYFMSIKRNKKTTITTKAKMTEKQSRKAATFNFILKINGKRYFQAHINLAHQLFNPFQRYIKLTRFGSSQLAKLFWASYCYF